ncbi:hypothetical protein MUP77_16355 [Candidatus Bathyarchaeota archaeon]|nr:hypothetical protein [Candidatus Bathyarchaeota archaeon]
MKLQGYNLPKSHFDGGKMVTINIEVPEDLIRLVIKEEKTTRTEFLHDLQVMFQTMVNKFPELWTFKKATGQKLDVDSATDQIMREAGLR